MHRFLSVCLSVSDWAKIHWTNIHMTGSGYLRRGLLSSQAIVSYNFYKFLNLQVAHLYPICRWAHLNIKLHFFQIFIAKQEGSNEMLHQGMTHHTPANTP